MSLFNHLVPVFALQDWEWEEVLKDWRLVALILLLATPELWMGEFELCFLGEEVAVLIFEDWEILCSPMMVSLT